MFKDLQGHVKSPLSKELCYEVTDSEIEVYILSQYHNWLTDRIIEATAERN